MSDLEQRLADELDTVVTGLHAPHVAVGGLVAAGRRERVRRRSAVASLVAAAVAFVAVAAGPGLPGGDDRAVDPARPPTGEHLARPLELPWWSGTHSGGVVDGNTQVSGGPDDGVLHVNGAQIPVRATRIVHAQGRTLVAHTDSGEELWSAVVGGSLEPVAEVPLTGPPLVGPDGTMAWVEDQGSGEYAVVRQSSGGSTATSMQGMRPVLAGLLPDGRVVLSTGDDGVLAWNPDDPAPSALTPLPRGLRLGVVASWPRGLSAYRDGTVQVGDVDAENRFQVSWEIVGDGSGAWSDDGKQYAEATDDGIRFATANRADVAPLDADLLRVVGWESGTEVVVAQWIEADGAVTGVWRCSATDLRCAEVADAPNGKALLPGL